MSDSWHEAGRQHGCTLSSWNRVRATVRARDGYRCRMGDPTHPIGRTQSRSPDCTGDGAQVHHTVGRSVTGDDPNYLVTSCKACNLAAGDPRKNNPQPLVRSRW